MTAKQKFLDHMRRALVTMTDPTSISFTEGHIAKVMRMSEAQFADHDKALRDAAKKFGRDPIRLKTALRQLAS